LDIPDEGNTSVNQRTSRVNTGFFGEDFKKQYEDYQSKQMIDAAKIIQKQKDQCLEAYTQDEAKHQLEVERNEVGHFAFLCDTESTPEEEVEEEKPFQLRSSQEVKNAMERFDDLFGPFPKLVAPKVQPNPSITQPAPSVEKPKEENDAAIADAVMNEHSHEKLELP
jgi:hypothetical protein